MATTWAATLKGHRAATATCTTGSEGAPTLASDGLDLTDLGAVALFYTGSDVLTAGGVLHCYLYNPVAAAWVRCPEGDTDGVPTGYGDVSIASVGFKVDSPVSRAAYVPYGMGVGGTVLMIGTRRPK